MFIGTNHRHRIGSIAAFAACSALATAAAWGQTPGLLAKPAPPVTLPAELMPMEEGRAPQSVPADATAEGRHSAIGFREALPATAESATERGASPPVRLAREPQRTAPRETPEQQPATAKRPELRPFKLRGITPGESTADEVRAAWGDAVKTSEQEKAVVWQYSLGPFPVVQATIQKEIVREILIELPEPHPVRNLVDQMGIADVPPGRIDDSSGRALGLVFPERGVAFVLLPTEDGRPRAIGQLDVTHIVIEPITSEPFVRRAESDLLGPCEANLRDLEQAIRLDPQSAQARYTLARFLYALGRYDDALRAATTATQLEPTSWAYRLLHAELQVEMGETGKVPELVEFVLSDAKATSLEKAQAHLLAAAASSRSADLEAALDSRRQAMELATPLVKSEDAGQRRLAKRLLMRANLGTARDVARGDFKDKTTVVPQWVTQGSQYAEDLIQNEQADELLRLEVARSAFAALERLGGQIDPTLAAERARENGRKLLAATEDPLRQSCIQWQLGLTLHDAMCIHYERREVEEAQAAGDEAIELLELASRMRQPSAAEKLCLGEAYFQRGALEAVFRQDHRAAVGWYEKALPLLDAGGPDAPAVNLGRHGERFVSMGVSFWSQNQRDQAMLITQRGMRFMEQAVEAGSLPQTALAVPYKNMAAMHRQLGQETQAAEFSRMAERPLTERPDGRIQR